MAVRLLLPIVALWALSGCVTTGLHNSTKVFTDPSDMYRNVLERRHLEKVPVPRHQAVRRAHQHRLQLHRWSFAHQ